MAYCTVANINAYYLGVEFTAGKDNLNDGQITIFIDEASAVIDASLRSLYTVPITEPTDKLVLQSLCEKMVVCKIDNVFTHDRGMKERGDREACKHAKDMIAALQSGKLGLISKQVVYEYCGGDEASEECSVSSTKYFQEFGCGCEE